ncbi:MAG: ECF transporter S component [Erysipelotrichaceae bacterium]
MHSSKMMAKAAMALAGIFLFTAFFAFPISNLGYLNIGDALILLFASFFQPWLAFFIAGTASMMADLSLGFVSYALFTFVIKGTEGFVVAWLLRGKQKKVWWVFLAGIGVMWIGYGIADVVLTQQPVMFLTSLGVNAIQAIGSYTLAMVAYPFFKKVMSKFV